MHAPLPIGEYEDALFHCPYCLWSGFGSETDPSITYGDLREVHCPSCTEVIGIVHYPFISASADCQCEPLLSLPFIRITGRKDRH